MANIVSLFNFLFIIFKKKILLSNGGENDRALSKNSKKNQNKNIYNHINQLFGQGRKKLIFRLFQFISSIISCNNLPMFLFTY
jgi:hypothetical protein